MKKSSSVGASSSASSTVPVPDDAPLAHDGDVRAELVHVAQDVRVEEHRLAALVQALDDALDLDAADRVEPGHRLVEQHELGVVDQRLGDADALQHALGVLAQVRVGGRLEADVAAAAPRRARAARSRVEAEQAGAEAQELAPGEVVVEVRVLGQVADLSRARRRRARTVPERRPHQPERDLDGGRLAGAVGPEQPEDVAAARPSRSTPLRISTRRRRKPTWTVLRRPLMLQRAAPARHERTPSLTATHEDRAPVAPGGRRA